MAGNRVSHAHNKVRRRFLPNLHTLKFWVEKENRWLKLRVSKKGMRLINKKGIDTALAVARKRGLVPPSRITGKNTDGRA